ncbi:MAG: amino acid adenylation domain-containing protein [Woeseiaceae bacterium]|nr:amino acid adenylation domain-containing protein [Woeseiaceae bacterium]
MTITQLLRSLRDVGIELTVDGGRLKCMAPKGAMTKELADKIREHKQALIDLLTQSSTSLAGRDESREIEPSPAGSRLALTTALEGFAFRQKLEPDSPFLNLPGAWHLVGDLDLDRLRAAINEFYRRHSILRATIDADEFGNCFRLSEFTELEIPLLDFSDSDVERRDAALIDYLESRGKDHVALDKGPLFQCEILNVDTSHHVLFVLVNHVVWDGWSFDIFLEEIDTFYRGSDAAPHLPIQYCDYANWQRGMIESAPVRAQIEQRANKLRDYSAHFELPPDRARPPYFGSNGSTEYFELPGALLSRLEDVCAERRITPFMLLVAVFKCCLSRFSGQRDIAIGSHVQNRTRSELDNLVGFFVNTMVVRTQIETEWTVSDLLSTVRESCLDAVDNRHVPIDALIRDLGIAPDPSNLPLVQVFFSYQDTSRRASSIGDIECRSVIRKTRTADADLTLWVRNFGDRMDGGFDYRLDLYDSTTIKSLRDAFVLFLDSLLKQPQRCISELPIVTGKDAADTIKEWSRVDEPIPSQSIYELVEAQVRRVPTNTAVLCGATGFSYGELNNRVLRYCAALRSVGVGHGDVVGVHMDRSADLVVVLLSILRMGAVYLPLDPTLPKDRLRFISDDADAKFLVSEPQLETDWCDDRVSQVEPPTGIEEVGEEIFRDEFPSPSCPAYMIYTSGSTGKPKGVVVSHQNVVNFLTSMSKFPGIDEQDKLLAVTTCSFDISVLEFFLPLICGAQVVVATNDEARDGARLLSLIDKLGITVFQSTPATWRMLLASGWTSSPKLKALCGGEALPLELARDVRPRVAALFNMYGPTETTVWSSVHEIDTDKDTKVPLGRPIQNTQFYVLDQAKRPLPKGAVGELYIGGVGVTLGYHKRDELTADRFVDSPFRDGEKMYGTGDLVRIGGSGELLFEGRIDDQIKMRGYRIELGEIENAFQQVDCVAQAAVLLKQLSADDHRLIAHVVSADDGPLSVATLRKDLRKLLPDYMIPQHIVPIDRLPLTPSGKVDRKALPDVEISRDRAQVEPPATETEKKIAEIWMNAIGVKSIDRRDHFFELGGHSLLAMRVLAEIESDLGHQVSAASLMMDSLQQIAAGIGVQPTSMLEGASNDSVPIQRRGVFGTIRDWIGQ